MDLKQINWRSRKTLLIGAAVLVCAPPVAYGMAQGVRDEVAASNASPSPSSSPTATATPTATFTPRPVLVDITPTLAPQADRDAAAAILNASIGHYRQVLAQGQAALGPTQYDNGWAGVVAIESDPNSDAAKFKNWHNPNPEMDLSYQDAFGRADAHFTAEGEPPAINTWRDDISQAVTDLGQWTRVADSWQIKEKTQADLDAAAAKVTQDLDTAARDAQKVVTGSGS